MIIGQSIFLEIFINLGTEFLFQTIGIKSEQALNSISRKVALENNFALGVGLEDTYLTPALASDTADFRNSVYIF